MSSSLHPDDYTSHSGSSMGSISEAVTPSTRAEAEAAFEANALTQTDSAGPDPTLSSTSPAGADADADASSSAGGGRPALPRRTSSGNKLIDAARARGPLVAAPFSPKSAAEERGGGGGGGAGAGAGEKESWRPRFDRSQSFKKEEIKRLIQEGMKSPPPVEGLQAAAAPGGRAD